AWNFLCSVGSNQWIALGTWVLVGVTAAAMYVQLRRQREANAVTLLVRLVETGDSDQMRRNRERLKHWILMKSPVAPIKGARLMGPVANFFELVGFFTRTGALTDEMVWSTFSYYVIPYFAAVKSRVEFDRRHEDDPSLYVDFEWLYEQMRRRRKSQ